MNAAQTKLSTASPLHAGRQVSLRYDDFAFTRLILTSPVFTFVRLLSGSLANCICSEETHENAADTRNGRPVGETCAETGKQPNYNF